MSKQSSNRIRKVLIISLAVLFVVSLTAVAMSGFGGYGDYGSVGITGDYGSNCGVMNTALVCSSYLAYSDYPLYLNIKMCQMAHEI
jgi:hypothetical protein